VEQGHDVHVCYQVCDYPPPPEGIHLLGGAPGSPR
jgi:hypothetical protein